MVKKRLLKILVSTAMAFILAMTPMISSNVDLTTIVAEADSNGFVIEDGVLTAYKEEQKITSGSAVVANSKLYLTIQSSEFIIRSSNGNYAKVNGYNVEEGNLAVQFSRMENGLGEASVYTYEVPVLEEGENYTVFLDADKTNNRISFWNVGKENNFSCSVTAEKSVSLMVDSDGNIKTKATNGEVNYQKISYGKKELNWVGTDIMGTDTGFSITGKNGKLDVASENNVQINLSISNLQNELSFDDIKTEDGIVVSYEEKETRDKDLYIVSDSKGNEIVKKEMGFKVSFYPSNDTIIKDIQNVVSGSAITEPEKPEREGYEFAGWYTDWACNEDEKWDFNEDKVIKNTSLWAKWVEIPKETVQPSQEPTPIVTPTKEPSTTISKPSKPTKVTLKNSAKKTLKVTWKKVSNATGYKVVYSTNKKFSKSKTKTVTVKNTKNSLTIKKLKKGKTYYVKVCAYKKSGKTTVYGKNSGVKKLKIKK